eukprot:scaffold212441_cov28-Prasinocladus_malaysianus.AAC.1
MQTLNLPPLDSMFKVSVAWSPDGACLASGAVEELATSSFLLLWQVKAGMPQSESPSSEFQHEDAP